MSLEEDVTLFLPLLMQSAFVGVSYMYRSRLWQYALDRQFRRLWKESRYFSLFASGLSLVLGYSLQVMKIDVGLGFVTAVLGLLLTLAGIVASRTEYSHLMAISFMCLFSLTVFQSTFLYQWRVKDSYWGLLGQNPSPLVVGGLHGIVVFVVMVSARYYLARKTGRDLSDI